MKTYHHYTYRVEWSPEDNEFAGLAVEFPSLSWMASTPQDALAGIVTTVENAVADMRANGEDAPAPLGDRHYSGKIALRTSPDLHRKLTVEAAEQGVSVNQWIVQKTAANVNAPMFPTMSGNAEPSSRNPLRTDQAATIIDVPTAILPLPQDVAIEIRESVEYFWKVVRKAVTQGVEVPGDGFLPGGRAPVSGQVLPDGVIMVFSADSKGRYQGFRVPNVLGRTPELLER